MADISSIPVVTAYDQLVRTRETNTIQANENKPTQPELQADFVTLSEESRNLAAVPTDSRDVAEIQEKVASNGFRMTPAEMMYKMVSEL